MMFLHLIISSDAHNCRRPCSPPVFSEKTNNAAGHAGDIELSNAGPIFRVDNVIAAGHAGDIELSNAGPIFRVDLVSAAGHAGVIETINASGPGGGLRRLGAQLIDWTTRSITTSAWITCNDSHCCGFGHCA